MLTQLAVRHDQQGARMSLLGSESAKLAATRGRTHHVFPFSHAPLQICQVQPRVCERKGLLSRCGVASLRPVLQTTASSDVDKVQVMTSTSVTPCTGTQWPHPMQHAESESSTSSNAEAPNCAQTQSVSTSAAVHERSAEPMTSPASVLSSLPLLAAARAAAGTEQMLTPPSALAVQQTVQTQAAQAAAVTTQSVSQAAPKRSGPSVEQCGKLWALAILCASYIHCAAVTCSIPVLMPMIADNLQLSGEFISCPRLELLPCAHMALHVATLLWWKQSMHRRSAALHLSCFPADSHPIICCLHPTCRLPERIAHIRAGVHLRARPAAHGRHR